MVSVAVPSWRGIVVPALASGDYTMFRKGPRLRSRGDGGLPVILRSTQGLIRARSLDVLHLLRYGAHVAFASSRELFGRGARADAAIPAVVADAGGVVVDDRRL